MKRFIRKFVLLCFALAALGAVGCGAGLYWLVVVHPGPEIDLDYIEGILGRESPVFYRDGTAKIGVLFQDAHRQYLPYHLIPKEFVNAIVAAEDDKFFDHHGIDVFGIARAMLANLKAGRIIQGGSTITQQTAKNLFKRESRTYRAKLKELLYALRLEYHYPKEKILEFYVNQFFVSGNGHGLGVAARYYFDKDAEELTLLENAFIAGSVKRPNYYNPFTKSSEDAAERARLRAEQRAAYVLGKMRRLGYISENEYNQAISSNIVFDRGRMSFSLNTVMDLVRDGLGHPEINRILDDNGISNVSTSGIKIITTIDQELQESTLYNLRRELSRLDVRLRGYKREEVQAEYNRLEYPGDTVMEKGAFLFGKVKKVERAPGAPPGITVYFDRKKTDGVIEEQGLARMVEAYARYKRQRWSEADKGDLTQLLDQVQEGDKIYVSVSNVSLSGTPELELERFPEIEGGALVMQDGAMRAMAGGMENRYFNRAVDARRLMGSTFKPFLFAAAIQLGWNTTDLLDNRRNIFVFQDMPYFPRPDHISPHQQVSLSWTGVNSENLAAIWLLYHLTDHLTPPRLREIAEYLDMAPRFRDGNIESLDHFKLRIRDDYGIVVDQEILEQAAYDRAVKVLEADFLFDNRAEEYRRLEQLPYGLHFDEFSEEVRLEMEEPDPETVISEDELKEMKLRLDILGRNFLRLREVMDFLKQQQVFLSREKGLRGLLFDPLAFLDKESGVLQPQGQFYSDRLGRVVFSMSEPQETWRRLSEEDMRSLTGELEESQLREFWEQVQLEGYLSVYAYQQLVEQMDKEKEDLFAAHPYSMEVLSEVRDYRIMVGLQYLIRLGHEVGITAELEPVLSFPLGSNVVSLLDAVRMYETLVTGKKYPTAADSHQAGGEDDFYTEGLAIIERIETVDGETIYARDVEAKNVIDPKTSSAVGNILQNTVRHGTGRYAYNNVRLTSSEPQRQNMLRKLDLPVPLLGKTGTANQFRNAAFMGYIPKINPGESEASLEHGFTLGVYVGFDDNRQMVRTSTHITGASGALPAWSLIADSVVNLDSPGDKVDLADLSFGGLPLRYPDTGQVFVPVDADEGGQIFSGRGALSTTLSPSIPSILTYGHVGDGGHFEPDRLFQPFWETAGR